MNSDEQHDLNWLAHQYVLDELQPSERAAFELRLAGDQDACDALARAVELSQLLIASQHVSLVTPVDREICRWRRAAGIAAAVAGCLAFVLALQIFRPLETKLSPIATGNGIANLDASSPELASAWIEMIDTWSATLVAGDGALLARQEDGLDEGELDEGELGEDESFGLTGSQSVDAPDWMMTAVSELHRGAMRAGVMGVIDMDPPTEN